MTTTLRPTGSEEPLPGGGRARTYEVCVNSRPVGRIGLRTDPELGREIGRIESLDIGERDRRRGRGTVAALAAEEVLRSWGCVRIETDVPADASAALRLAAALGYTERGRRMRKALTREPSLPEGSAARPVGAEEYPAWLEAAQAGYVAANVRQGMDRGPAERRSRQAHRALLPDGPATPGQRLRVLNHRGTDVGSVWVALGAPDEPGGYVYDIRVDPDHRGRGHGRTLMLVAERECLAAGLRHLGLHVGADNPRARGLYESLGYRPTAYGLRKRLL